MRPLCLLLVLGGFTLGLLGLAPSEAEAYRRRRGYYPRPVYYYPPPPPWAYYYYPPPGLPYTSYGTYPPVYPVPERQAVVQVGLYDNYFQPGTVTVSVGTTVQWTNYGQHDHTVTSDTGLWDSGELGPLGLYDYTFAQPGIYPYHCTIHSRVMRGTVVVR